MYKSGPQNDKCLHVNDRENVIIKCLVPVAGNE